MTKRRQLHQGLSTLCVWLLWSATLLGWPTAAHSDERAAIEATINGKPARLALDTGSSDAILFRAGAERLGLKMHTPSTMPAAMRASGVSAKTDRCELRFGSTVAEATFVVVDLPPGIQMDIDGVLGWLPLCDNVIVFDGPKAAGQIRSDLPEEAAKWQQVRVRRAITLQLEVPLTDGRPGIVFVDSGSDSGVQLTPDQWKNWSMLHQDQPATLVAFFTPAEGLVVRKQMWAKELTIGALALTDVPVSEATKADASIPDHVATLGLYGLRRLSVAVDARNGIAYVKPSGAVAPAFQHNRLGAVFVPRDLKSDPLIAQVVHGSPADRAGIRDGDVLVGIGDLDVTKRRTDKRIMPLSRFFERPAGTELDLTIERAGQRQTMHLTLEDILSPAAVPTSQPSR